MAGKKTYHPFCILDWDKITGNKDGAPYKKKKGKEDFHEKIMLGKGDARFDWILLQNYDFGLGEMTLRLFLENGNKEFSAGDSRMVLKKFSNINFYRNKWGGDLLCFYIKDFLDRGGNENLREEFHENSFLLKHLLLREIERPRYMAFIERREPFYRDSNSENYYFEKMPSFNSGDQLSFEF